MLISLGGQCKVREAIQRHLNTNSLETNIFDWVLSDFEAVLYFIKNINTPINVDDFVDTNKTVLQSHRIISHRFLQFESLHDSDIKNDATSELVKLVEKYNRRLNRLKTHIMYNNKIDFIHSLKVYYTNDSPQLYIPSVTQIQEFTETILQINPNCGFNLHILIPPPYCKKYKWNISIDETQINQLKINDNVHIYYLQQDENKPTFEDQCQHWSWEYVFQNLK